VSAFSPNGKLLAQGTEEGVVLVVDIQATRHQFPLCGDNQPVLTIQFIFKRPHGYFA
jgi:hypothetical protein